MHLGIDLGTSEVKVLLLDDNHKVLGQQAQPLTVSRPQPLWSEQQPDDWWRATEAAVGRLRTQHPQAFARIRGIGLSGQMHGAVLLGDHAQVLRPAILWNDGRSHEECRELTALAPRLHSVAGNLAMPGFTAPKLLWVNRHEPDVFARIRQVLLPKDYLRLRMTGQAVSEPSDAAGTLWLDVAARDWSDDLLAACGLNRTQMPRLVEGSAVSATLLPEVASAWGLGPDVLVAGGAGDNAASAVGIGATQPGDGFISLGTSGVLFVVTDRHRPNPGAAVHAFCHALPGRWHQMSVMLSAASCLKWWSGLSGMDEATLVAEATTLSTAARSSAPLFLPYLGGERTPHNNPFAQASFQGLSHDTDRAACTYAVLEGVAFGLADGLAALQQAGTQVSRLSLVGGGSRSPFWAQLLANVLDVEIVTHVGGETGAALGAARLARLASGAAEETVCRPPEVLARYRPLASHRDLLQSRLQRFRQFFPQVRPLFPTAPTALNP